MEKITMNISNDIHIWEWDHGGGYKTSKANFEFYLFKLCADEILFVGQTFGRQQYKNILTKQVYWNSGI